MKTQLTLLVTAVISALTPTVHAEPALAGALVIEGSRLDASGGTLVNDGRLGFFSDLYYDPNRGDWWALSDRGPGGGVMDYATRVQKISLAVHPLTGQISHFHVEKTVPFSDPFRLLSAPTADVGSLRALNGLNPFC